jgi:hypothetical protein
VTNRRPYVASGRQIDGSVTVEGTTYLTELKFTTEQASAPDIDTFLAKINDKADNTMGVMVSMSGYSSTAIQQASGRKTPVILMDFSHVYLLLGGTWTLPEVVSRLAARNFDNRDVCRVLIFEVHVLSCEHICFAESGAGVQCERP